MIAHKRVILSAILVALVHLGVCFDVGIGMNLALDYGVVSVRFANGSQVDVAKIEGGTGYKHTMRAQNWTTPDDSEDSTFGPTTGSLSHAELEDNVGQRSFRDHVPCWLGGRACQKPVDDLAPMLQALKVAASSYLGTKVTSSIIALQARPSEQMLRSLDRAASRASLRLQMWLASPAGQMAAYANGLSDAGCQQGERRILTVEYSRAALTILLLDEYCGVFEGVRGSYNPDLGADNWSSEVKDAMLSEIRKVARNEKSPGTHTRGFDELVLLGELGDEHRLRGVLEEAFAHLQVISGVRSHAEDREMIPPLFAGARGAAIASLHRAEEGSEEARKPSRSWLRSGAPELR